MSIGNEVQTQFTNSCQIINYRCTVGTMYIDPCSCARYFQCQYTDRIITRSCGNSTFWNHQTGFCIKDSDVVHDGLCKSKQPWERCSSVANVTSDDLRNIESRCTGKEPVKPTPGGQTGNQGGEPTGADNTGAIVGGVVGGLVVIALVLALLIFLKKKGKPISHYMQFLGSKKPVSNPEYEENYTEIGDIMHDPVYNNAEKSSSKVPTVPGRPEFTLSPALNVGQLKAQRKKEEAAEEERAYDNPGYTRSLDDNDDIMPHNCDQSAGPPGSPAYTSLESDGNSFIIHPPPYTALSVMRREAENGTMTSQSHVSTVGEDGYHSPMTRNTEN